MHSGEILFILSLFSLIIFPLPLQIVCNVQFFAALFIQMTQPSSSSRKQHIYN